jgi:hypothetical protein
MYICIFDWEISGNYLHKPCSTDTTEVVLVSFGKSFAPLGILQYISITGSLHHGRMAQWSAAATCLKFEPFSTQIILDQMRLEDLI